MTGRAKIEAALSPEGTAEIPAVLCYEGIYIRDHWAQLTTVPWWHQESPDLEQQLGWRREVIQRTGQDWMVLPSTYTRQERRELSLETRDGERYLVNRQTAQERRLQEPQIGGWSATAKLQSVRPSVLPATSDEIAEAIPLAAPDPQSLRREGSADLADRLLAEHGDLYPIRHVGGPLWSCYSLWGFEHLMVLVATQPGLVEQACRRYLEQRIREVHIAAALGAAGVWIEDCMTDMVGPPAFAALNVAHLRPLVEAIRAAGLKSIYYFCGDPTGKWKMLLDVGADALSLEESKKGWAIDIEDVVDRVQGRCAVLGNLDAIGVLQDGPEAALRAEIARQITAGRRNGSRFIMSLGSPVTPGTPVARVRRYCDLVRELGS